MVAYDASKKLNVDPWVGATVMAALMTPNFVSLDDTTLFPDTVCTVDETLGTQSCVAHVFGLPLQINDYSGQVFVPLIMVAVLAWSQVVEEILPRTSRWSSCRSSP